MHAGHRDPVRLYAFALREGDERLAELLRRRLAHRVRELVVARAVERARRGSVR